MMMNEKIEYEFKSAMKLTGNNATAAAILVLADVLAEGPDITIKPPSDGSLSHEICMGIRHGLFGARAHENTSIVDLSDTSNHDH